MNKFSVIIPTFNRPEKIRRAVESVLKQTYREYEIIVIDDGSTECTCKVLNDIWDRRLVVIKKSREQRLIARNIGMRAAKFEWICWMDDDDEYMPNYLEEFNKAIEKEPKIKVFQCTVQFYKIIEGQERKLRILLPVRLQATTSSGDFKNPWLYEHFCSGKITTGQFIFKKECLDRIGYLPDTSSYGQFAIDCGIPGYGWRKPDHRHPKRWVQVLGNPWGEDFNFFYKLTRIYNVGSISQILYKKNCR